MRMRFWRRPPLSAEKRHALEQWIRLRFLVLEHDPMVAIIGAVARLTDEGMEQAAAIQLVVEILGEGTPAEIALGGDDEHLAAQRRRGRTDRSGNSESGPAALRFGHRLAAALKQSVDRWNRPCLDRDEKAWEATTGATQREDRPVYGCVDADRPEAQPYIDDVDGVLYYTCPACREELKGIFPTLGRAQ